MGLVRVVRFEGGKGGELVGLGWGIVKVKDFECPGLICSEFDRCTE